MNSLFGQFSEETIEGIKQAPQKVVNQIGQQTKIASQLTASQLTGIQPKPQGEEGQKTMEAGQSTQPLDDTTKDFLKDLYGPSQPTQTNQQVDPAQAIADDQKKLEEARKKMQAWQQQHMTSYFEPTFNRKKKPEDEEKPAEKVEREKMEELAVEQEKDKKKMQPLAVQMEAQKAERFRGASG